MAMRVRRNGGNGLDAWPGYVDALSTLLMVIIFVLLVFVLAQGFLSATLFNSIVADMVRKDWAPLCEATVESARSALHASFVAAFTAELPERFPGIAESVMECIEQVFDTCTEEAEEHLEKVLFMDENP